MVRSTQPDAPLTERESIGIALGGLLSSSVLLVLLIALGQIVTSG